MGLFKGGLGGLLGKVGGSLIKGPGGAIRVVDPSGNLIGSLPKGFSHPELGSVINYQGPGGQSLRGIYRGRGGMSGNFAPGDTFSHAEGGDVVRKSVRQAMGMDNERQSTYSGDVQDEGAPPGSFDTAPRQAPQQAPQENPWGDVQDEYGEAPMQVGPSPSLAESRPDLYPIDPSNEIGRAVDAADLEAGVSPPVQGMESVQQPPMQQQQQPQMRRAQEAPPPQIVNQEPFPGDKLMGYKDPTELEVLPPPTEADQWADVKAELKNHSHMHAKAGEFEMEITPPPIHGDPADSPMQGPDPVEFGPQTMVPVPGSPRALEQAQMAQKAPVQSAEAGIPVSPPPRPGAPAGMVELPQPPQFNATGSVEYDYPIANAQVQYPGPTPPMPDRKPSQNPFFAEGDPSMPTRNPQRGMVQEASVAPPGFNVAQDNDIWQWVHSLPANEQMDVKRAIAHEARGDGPQSMAMVARAIKTRWENSGKSIREILDPVQFSGFNPNKKFSKADMARVDQALAMGAPSAPITHYHADYVNPGWAGNNFLDPSKAGSHIGGTLKQGDPWLRNNPDRDMMPMPPRKPEAPMDPHGMNSEGFPVMRLGPGGEGMIPESAMEGLQEKPQVPGSSATPPVGLEQGDPDADPYALNTAQQFGYGFNEEIARQALRLADWLPGAGGFTAGEKAAKDQAFSSYRNKTAPYDDIGQAARNIGGYLPSAFTGGVGRGLASFAGSAIGGEAAMIAAKQAGLPEWGQALVGMIAGGVAGAGVSGGLKGSQTIARPSSDRLKYSSNLFKQMEKSPIKIPQSEWKKTIGKILPAAEDIGKNTEFSRIVRQAADEAGLSALPSKARPQSEIGLSELMKIRLKLTNELGKSGYGKTAPDYRRDVIDPLDDFISKEAGKVDPRVGKAIDVAKENWARGLKGETLENWLKSDKSKPGQLADVISSRFRREADKILDRKANPTHNWTPEQQKIIFELRDRSKWDDLLKKTGDWGLGGTKGDPAAVAGVLSQIYGPEIAAMLGAGGAGVAAASGLSQILGLLVAGGTMARVGRSNIATGKVDALMRNVMGTKQIPVPSSRLAAPLVGASYANSEAIKEKLKEYRSKSGK